jgi:hypothetical protein
MTPSVNMSIALEFRPSVDGISATRRFVSDVAVECLRDRDWTSRVALATQELLENSLKYSVDGAAALTIAIAPDDHGATVSVRVRSRGQAVHVVVLRRLLQEIGNASDPMAYYLDVMRRSAKQTDGSGLGLARIRAETEMSLSAEFDGDDVCVLAQGRVVAPGGHEEKGAA